MSMTSEPYIIAEIGSNLFKHDPRYYHLTNLDMGVSQIQAAKESGADAVKFQMFTVKELYGPRYPGPESPYALPREWVPVLAEECQRVGIDFMCSAFSVDGYKFIDPYVKMHKVASPEVTHPELLNWLFGENDKPVLWSDGCTAAVPEVFNAIRMTCVSKYPAAYRDYTLVAPPFDELWGISDHTMFSTIARKAREMGATYFERHVDFFTDEGMSTPDRVVSSTGPGFSSWAKEIRGAKKISHNNNTEARKKYGRVKKDGGWYRPWPEGE